MRMKWFWFLAFTLLIVGAYLLYDTWGRDAVDGHLCAQEYARAHTASDSVLIDARSPNQIRGQGELAGPIPTCGELRRLGKVK